MKEKGFVPLLTPIGALVMVLVIAGAYYLGTTKNTKQKQTQPIIINQNTPQPTQIPSTTPSTNYTYHYGTTYQILSGCNQNECLFNSPSEEGVVEGYAKLEGYIHTYEDYYYGNKITCSSILVTGGNEKLIKSFKTQIKKGNGLNKLDKNNNLLVTINLNDLDPTTKSFIESSNENKKIEIGLIRRTPRPIGASACTGFVEILFVKSLSK